MPQRIVHRGTSAIKQLSKTKIEYVIYKENKKTEYIIRYTVRNVLEGEYAVESAVVVNPNTNEIGFSEESTIAID